nr:HAD-IIA family hydrolase [Brevibacterium marinum]
MFDLDGVVYHGSEPIPGALESIEFLYEQSIPVNYVTNNATRTPEAVADRISTLGISTTPAEVTTSAQVLAGRLAAKFGTGAPIYVVGARGLITALQAEGLTVTDTLEDNPVAIAQGLDPDITYQMIVRAAEAITSGLEWWASNPDYSMVGARSRVPGNGAFIDMLSRLTGAQPTIVGKPSPHMMEYAAHRLGAGRPLMIGDRLDTDIEGGNAAGYETALVLTGIHDIHDALRARPGLRPTYILPSLRSLPALISGTTHESGSTHESRDTDESSGAYSAAASADCRIVDGELRLDDADHAGPSAVHTALRTAWESMDRGHDVGPGNLPRRIHD